MRECVIAAACVDSIVSMVPIYIIISIKQTKYANNLWATLFHKLLMIYGVMWLLYLP